LTFTFEIFSKALQRCVEINNLIYLSSVIFRFNPFFNVHLPPYSSDLNPIEQVWRAIKRENSTISSRDMNTLLPRLHGHLRNWRRKEPIGRNGWRHSWVQSICKDV